MNTPDKSPRSLRRLLDIFGVIAAAPDGLTLAELSVRTQSPKSSLLTLLRPLSGDGYLIHRDGRYTLGSEIYALSEAILSARKVGNLLKDVMREAHERCGETIVHAALTREGNKVAYVDVIESRQVIRYSVPAGVIRPLYTSAAGQLLLAFKDEGWQKEYFRQTKLEPLTSKTITDVEILRKKLRKIRDERVSLSVSEAIDGASGVAAPIFNSDGSVLAALLIAGPSTRLSRERSVWRTVAVECAAKASRAMGYVEPE